MDEEHNELFNSIMDSIKKGYRPFARRFNQISVTQQGSKKVILMQPFVIKYGDIKRESELARELPPRLLPKIYFNDVFPDNKNKYVIIMQYLPKQRQTTIHDWQLIENQLNGFGWTLTDPNINNVFVYNNNVKLIDWNDVFAL